jgi:pyruvate/2-oxoglutarate dehydrogenase complex dihydrolipoamide acyltransferase (E2) component
MRTMVQSRVAIRIGLVAACVIVLGVGAVVVSRALTANVGEAAPSAPVVATPKVDEPSMALSTPATAPTAAAIAAEAQSREASWRESREAAIRVQQRLRAQQQARKSAQEEGAKNERCVDGLRMKRVENGWVQAGNC